MDIIANLAKEFGISASRVENTVKLIDDGNTIPFIARYRKEVTGSLDDQVLRSLNDRLNYLRSLDENAQKILKNIEEQGKLDDELREKILAAVTLTELEDLYRPYKPKRKTRASVAKDKGLQPLAEYILDGNYNKENVYKKASEFITEEVENEDDALQGASDIIAEIISDDAEIRKTLREEIYDKGVMVSALTKCENDESQVYKNYYEYSEAVKRIPGHRILALNRGEKEKALKVNIDFDEDTAVYIIAKSYVKNNSFCGDFIESAARDSYTRLIFPSVSNEVRNALTDDASSSAIKVFGINLRQLLLQPPLKGSIILGLDPGYRTGCKVAVINENGKVLDTGVIYPAPPHNKLDEAKAKVTSLINKYGVNVISIGNGTASHETEVFVSDLLSEIDKDISYMVVSEAGASVYSASKLAAEEFPQYDVSLRSAVSIARRLQDPLAELVKIEPKAIGVGQYQHDMPQKELDSALKGVVEDTVNTVGVDLNTASPSLLQYVAGINASIAKNIVTFRDENGGFKSRTELKKVAKLGPKAFTQCAGFLRIVNGKNPLDATAVHPESYDVAKKVTEYAKADGLDGIDINAMAEELGVGVPTLKDIITELKKPGRDIRDSLPAPMLKKEILSIESLKPGMELKGTVRNLVDFGAFVDVGVHQDGLVHISRISDKFIKHPSEVLKVGDIITVWVLDVDVEKKRISLTCRSDKG